MELYVDLLQKGKKSKNNIAFGFVWLILGVVYFFSKIYAGQDVAYTDYIFSVGFVLLGTFFLFKGFGKPLERYLGKSYLQLTKKELRLKRTVFEKEKEYLWDDIKAANFDENKLYLNNDFVFDLSDLAPVDIEHIKEFIAGVVVEKGIEV